MKIRAKKKRLRSDLIIRLTDVVFILLFGFIAISEISKKSKIELAKSSAVPATAADREQVIYVGVLPDSRFLVEEETKVLEDANMLSRYIANKRTALNSRNLTMRVRVRANHDAPVKPAFTIINICRDMKIPVGLDVIKKR